MFGFLINFLLVARSRLKSRASLEAENPVLGQQVIVLSRLSFVLNKKLHSTSQTLAKR